MPVHQTIVNTNPSSNLSNSQPAGIGRLVSLNDTLFINNLGRNIEVSRPRNGTLEPQAFDFTTRFPDDDEKSQFDLDYHAFLISADCSRFLGLNHYGYIRLFNMNTCENNQHAELVAELKWPGDVERFQFSGNCFVSTSPAGYAVDDASEPGMLFSDPLDAFKLSSTTGITLAYEKYLEDWGITTNFKLSGDCGYMAVAAGNHLGLIRMELRDNGLIRPGGIVWETDLDYSVGFIEILDDDNSVLAAGSPADPQGERHDDTDWSHLKGGVCTVLSQDKGSKIRAGSLDADIAWGNGGTALVLIDRSTLAGVDRQGGLHAWTVNGHEIERYTLVQPDETEVASLGIAHVTRLNNEIFCGFNRGGYRLWKYTFS